ncbi:MAG: hypothetical protein WA734_17295, partial [Candidatus Acidiferrales bacterium]
MGILDIPKDFLERWAWIEPKGLQVVASNEPGGPNLLWRGLGNDPAHEIVDLELPMAREAIHPMQFKVLIEFWKADEALQG